MGRVDVLKNNCTSGEITPKMHKRSDIEQHKNGLATCLNGFVSPYGGVIRRNGTKYIAAAKYADRVCIVRDFVFSEDQAYTLEIGHLYIRFYLDKAQIIHSLTTTDTYAGGTTYAHGDYIQDSGIIYRSKEDDNIGNTPASSPTYWSPTSIVEVTTTFEEDHLRGLRFEQSADVLYIYHSTATAKLTRFAHTLWTITSEVFTGGPFLADNETVAQLQSTTAAVGTTSISVTGFTPVTSGDLMPGSNCVDPAADAANITGLTAFCDDASMDYSVTSSTSATGVTGYCLECINTKFGRIDNGSNAQDVWDDGTYIYLANLTGGLRAYTFDGTTFTAVGNIDDGGSAYGVWGDGTYIYLANGSGGLRAYTFNGTTFTGVGNINEGGTAYRVWGDGTYIYIANAAGGLVAYSFNGTTFTSLDTVIDGADARDVWGDGTYIYLADDNDGLIAYTFNGTTFTKIDSVDAGGTWGVWGDGTYIYAAVSNRGLKAYTFNGTNFTNVGNVDDGSYAQKIWGDGTYIYLANYNDGLRSYTFSGTAFTNIGHVDDGDYSRGVWGDGTYIYLANSAGGLRAYTPSADGLGSADVDTGVSLTITGLSVGYTYTLKGSFKLVTYDGDAFWQAKAYLEAGTSKTEYTTTTSWQEKQISFSAEATTIDLEFGLNVERLSGLSSHPSVELLWDDVTFISETPFFYSDHIGSIWKLTGGKTSDSVTGSFTGVAASSAVETASEDVVIEVTAGTWVAEIVIQRSFNKGTDWYNYQTIPNEGGVFTLSDNRDIWYRLNCAAFTSGTIVYQIYMLDLNSDGVGTFEITAVDSDGLGCTATIINELSSTEKTILWAEPEFSDLRGYPAAGKIYEGRMFTTGTTENPTGSWFSSSIDFNDMAAGIEDADAGSFSLDARGGLNGVKWLAAWDKLLIGTAGGEVRLESDGITPSNPPNKKQDSNYGSADIQAFLAARALLFIDKSKRTLREYIYDDATNSYDAASLSVIGEHVLRGGSGAVDAAFQQKQNAIVWCVLTDGSLGCLTYMPLHSVAGWHRHITDGSFESISIIPGNEGADEVWFAVKRTINGADVRYIEVLEEETADYNQMVFLDSALTYSGSAITEVSGLDHLEGEVLYGLADGLEVGPYTVASAAITLDTAASELVLGKLFTTTIKTLEPDVGSDSGTTYGQMKDIYKAIIHFVDTGAGVKVGLDTDNMLAIPELVAGQANTVDAPVLVAGGDGTAAVIVEISSPTPMYMAAITYDVTPGDE